MLRYSNCTIKQLNSPTRRSRPHAAVILPAHVEQFANFKAKTYKAKGDGKNPRKKVE